MKKQQKSKYYYHFYTKDDNGSYYEIGDYRSNKKETTDFLLNIISHNFDQETFFIHESEEFKDIWEFI